MLISVMTSAVRDTAVVKRSHFQEHEDHLDFYFNKYLFICMNVLPACMDMHPVQPRQKASEPLELELQMVESWTWALATKPGSSAGATEAADC